MPDFRRKLIQPYGCDDLFDLVLDIERYPEFVPGWRQVRVLERGADWLRVEQRTRIGPLPLRFDSRAEFERSRWIRIESDAPPFRRLIINWRFRCEPAGCLVEFDASLSMSAMNRFAKPLLELMGGSVIRAFRRRAKSMLTVVDLPTA